MGEATGACFASLRLAIRGSVRNFGCESLIDIPGFTPAVWETHAPADSGSRAVWSQLHTQARLARAKRFQLTDARLTDEVSRQRRQVILFTPVVSALPPSRRGPTAASRTWRHFWPHSVSRILACIVQRAGGHCAFSIESNSKITEALSEWITASTSSTASGFQVGIRGACRTFQRVQNLFRPISRQS